MGGCRRDTIIPPDYALCHNHMPSSVVDQIDANDNRLVLSPFCFGHADLQLKLLESGFGGLAELQTVALSPVENDHNR